MHNLSRVKHNKRKTFQYATLDLQTSETESQEVLLYSKFKRSILQDSAVSRSPVKIRRFTHTDDGKKVIINDVTNISTPSQSEYLFQYEQKVGTPMCSAAKVLNDCSEWDLVTVRGKVLRLKKPTVVGSTSASKQQLKLCEGLLGDESGAIPLDVWESHIDQIQEGGVYSFSPVQKKISTVIRTAITPIENPTLASLSSDVPDTASGGGNTCSITVTNISSVEKFESFSLFKLQQKTSPSDKHSYCSL